ncbi:peroxiredoxin-2E-2 [Pyrus ussuriensis x Pyrus communis]|uniref:Glutaredoxin-dependent peroxiredoxin n=1 Tax=Pyrus ussuriensis x Pyrus communis TaxID=2448454 RepID=A0A5N5FX46_9ROSA|nr:peroxiredoxin-2E-2 [Pyrus ussuriensis x Pyrus communis]
MAASLTVSRLLTAPKSLSFSTTTAAAPPKTSLFSPKSFSSKSSYTPLPLKHSPHPKPLLRFSTTAAKPISATIAVGDKLPEATLAYLDAAGDVQTVTVSELTKSKKAVLFAVPGAFTPTCSQKHVPGFGVETIACIAVNDVFVIKAWKENLNIGDEVLLLSDGNGDFTRAIGAELDLSDKPVGLGVRSRRYSFWRRMALLRS